MHGLVHHRAEPPRRTPRGHGTPLVMLPAGDDPIYARLYRAIRNQLLSGSWAPGTRLPSTRLLAHDLGISRGTATIAIEQLIAEGWLTSETRSGVYVARRPSAAPQATDHKSPRPPLSEREPHVPLSDLPMDLFPIGRWRKLHAKIWATADKTDLLLTDEAPGHFRLRQALSRFLLPARGLHARTDQLVICTSAIAAVEIAVRTVAPRGGRIVVENPGDPQLAARLRLGGFEVVPLELDSNGLLIDRLPTDRSIAAVVVSAALHWPTGSTLSDQRRGDLMRWARDQGAAIIERDCDGHVARQRGKPVLPLRSTHGGTETLYVSGLDRVAFPGLNLAFLMVPEAGASAAQSARSAVDRRLPISDQLVLAEFIESGAMAAWTRVSGSALVARRKALENIFAPSLGRLFSGMWASGGILGLASTGEHTEQLIALFTAWGVRAERVSAYATGMRPVQQSLAVACSGVTVSQAREMAPALGQALYDLPRPAH